MSFPGPFDTLMTVEEFERYRGDEGYLFELVRGVLVREPGPGPIHGRPQSRMAHLLEIWMEERGERGAVMTRSDPPRSPDPPRSVQRQVFDAS